MTTLGRFTPFRKKCHSAAVALAALYVLASCVYTQYPLAENNQQVIFREEFLGTWQENEGSTLFLVQKGEGSSYRILEISQPLFDSAGSGSTDKDTSEYTGQLVQVQEMLFLDLTTAEPKELEDTTKTAKSRIIIALDEYSKNKVTLLVPNPKSLRELIENKKVSVKHTFDGDNVVLQEPPGQLQEFLVRLRLDHPEVWEHNLIRRK